MLKYVKHAYGSLCECVQMSFCVYVYIFHVMQVKLFLVFLLFTKFMKIIPLKQRVVDKDAKIYTKVHIQLNILGFTI